MRIRIRPIVMIGALVAVALGVAVVRPGSTSSAPQAGKETQYVVLYREGVSPAAGRAAIAAAGGSVVRENTRVGLATVRTDQAGFAARLRAHAAIEGVARNVSIGAVSPGRARDRFALERLDAERQAMRGPQRQLAEGPRNDAPEGFEPFAPLQWDMMMIHATALESHDVQAGDPGVRVGVLDTGIDASHPDLARNFSARLSRNFTEDIPLIDGPCEDEPDESCTDPADVDEGAHGTHVAGTIAAAVNNLGIAGVAPQVTLVNLRAGQDSGFFFLQPTVDALTYAGDNGIDVVNMSYYIDPWLYNCAANPADSPEAQLEQQTIVKATQRALRYANAHGVTLVSSLGNEHTDLDNPTFDDTSPDFPPDAAYDRTVDNGCLSLPTEGFRVIGVSAVGPSTAKADYSNWSVDQTDVSAPGGWFRDWVGTIQHRDPRNLVLSTYAENVGREVGDIDETGEPTNPFVLKDCRAREEARCAYYTYFQGTSMASPHATGVAALIVSEYGQPDPAHGGLTLDPAQVERILERTASDHPCPEPRLFSYANVDRGPEFDATCVGDPERNSFYGHGIVDALQAVIAPGN